MASSKKTIAVIGAGASGLTAIKCCLDEDLDPVCFERSSFIGGLWHYSDKIIDGQGSVAKTTIVNTSKELMAFSDFPIPKEYPNFMHNSKVLDYLHLYAQNFDLKRHILFNTEILRVSKAEDFGETGRWVLTIKDNVTQNVTTKTFDGVMLCTGHLACQHVPRFQGDDVFKGRIMHSIEYRNHSGFEDKTVVIVGLGNSGGDAAVDLSRISKQVYLSTRRGSWVSRRLGPAGLPADLTLLSRSFLDMLSLVPLSIRNTLAENMVSARLDHALYKLKPAHRFFSQHVFTNDELPSRIASGTITIKPDIKRFTENGVEFVDGSKVEDVDIIILATGYNYGFPFLDKGIVDVEQNKVELYKYVFPPDMEHHTLATIGFVSPLGAVNPISELQSRWATRVFKKSQRLPDRGQMWTDIHKKREEMYKRYVNTQRYTIQIDVVPYMDEIADLMGCRPSLARLFLQDFKLARMLYFGPCTAYQFRLVGPGKWPGARETILTHMDRVLYPLNQQSTRPRPSGLPWKGIFCIVLVAIFLWMLWK